MTQYKIPLFFLLLLSVFEISQCYNNTKMVQSQSRVTKSLLEIRRRIRNFVYWMKGSFGVEDSFVGRCAHLFRRLRMSISFIIFKLGVIATTLLFLTLLMFKSIAIGVVLLILTSSGLATKFVALKHHGIGYGSHSLSDRPIHLHVYNKGELSNPSYHYDHSLKDLDDDELYPRNELEELAIENLYKRLGIKSTSSHISRIDKIKPNYYYRHR